MTWMILQDEGFVRDDLEDLQCMHGRSIHMEMPQQMQG